MISQCKFVNSKEKCQKSLHCKIMVIIDANVPKQSQFVGYFALRTIINDKLLVYVKCTHDRYPSSQSYNMNIIRFDCITFAAFQS